MESPNRDNHEGSLYNLALNGMNMDELKNGISVEESQLLRDPSSSSSSSSSSSPSPSVFPGNFRSSWNKTADEVWKELVSQENDNNNAKEMNQSSNIIHQQEQQQGGEETTLEEFLFRAGIINVGNHIQNGVHHQPIVAVDPMVVVSQHAHWMQPEMRLFDPMVVDAVGYSENQLPLPMTMPIPIPIPEMSTTTSPESQEVAEKKRKYSDEMMEKSFERKKKRMIKNRESAARSRARKQAYTNRLEHEVFLSRKTNSWLKKLKGVEMILSSDLTPTPRYELRRTSSSSF